MIEIVVVLIVVGVLLWLVNTYIPMAAPIKSLLNAVVVIVMVVWILKVFGLWHYITHIRAG
ncbi:MAG: Thivi_2564 family membrane protein [Candidatus Cybelea sp.]